MTPTPTTKKSSVTYLETKEQRRLNDTRESGTLSDVVIWSDTKGLFGGAAVGATRVAIDQKANQAYYNEPDVTPEVILSGLVANSASNILREVLPMQRASK